MRFDLFTLFPDICRAYVQESILKRAQAAGLLEVHVHNLRDHATGKHLVTDDLPYGGGGGMVMKPEPVFAAVESVLAGEAVPVILMTPQGRPFTQRVAQELAAHPRLALVCGRYEGFDERIRQHLATDEISLGDFVLTGGELPALAVVDAVARLLPGVLGDPTGAQDDSHAAGLLEYPHYTRPPEFRGWAVPPVLLSGDHARIERWRREQSLRRTFERRPDLLLAQDLSEAEKRLLGEIAAQTARQPARAVAASAARAWDVLLLGGAAGVGKSSVGYRLARHFGVALTEVDDFQVLLERLTTPEQQPALHFWRTHPAPHTLTAQAIFEQGLALRRALTPGLEAVVANHLESAAPVVLEGDFIDPALAAQAAFDGQPNAGRVRAVFLLESDEEQLVENFRRREPQAGEQRTRAQVSALYSRWLAAEAARYGLPVVPARPWETVFERVLAVLDP